MNSISAEVVISKHARHIKLMVQEMRRLKENEKRQNRALCQAQEEIQALRTNLARTTALLEQQKAAAQPAVDPQQSRKALDTAVLTLLEATQKKLAERTAEVESLRSEVTWLREKSTTVEEMPPDRLLDMLDALHKRQAALAEQLEGVVAEEAAAANRAREELLATRQRTIQLLQAALLKGEDLEKQLNAAEDGRLAALQLAAEAERNAAHVSAQLKAVTRSCEVLTTAASLPEAVES